MDDSNADADADADLPPVGVSSSRRMDDSNADADADADADLPPVDVLFVCVHNAGRSQMAAALLDHHGRGRVRVRSAGSVPAETVNPAVVAALGEWGIDVSGAVPKRLGDDTVEAADVVVTMGCGDACPVFPGKRYSDWDLPDPAGKPLEEVRAIRDEIDRRVRSLLDEIATAE